MGECVSKIKEEEVFGQTVAIIEYSFYEGKHYNLKKLSKELE